MVHEELQGFAPRQFRAYRLQTPAAFDLLAQLGRFDPCALRQAGERVPDWSGGTRLGECLRRFNDEWGVRGMARNSIVVILSDGWDRGDPEALAEQMRRLRRITYRTIWVNPL